MLPKEHGGWVMYIMPFFIGWAVAGRSTTALLLLFLVMTLFFMARYCLNVVVSESIKQNKNNLLIKKASKWLLIYSLVAFILAVFLYFYFKLYLLILFFVFSLLILLINLFFVYNRNEMTSASQVIGSLGLSLSAPAAYYVCTKGINEIAIFLWIICFFYQTGEIYFVRFLITKKNSFKDFPKFLVFYLIVILLFLYFLRITNIIAPFILLSFLPSIIKFFIFQIDKFPKLTIKKVGLLELTHSIIFLILVILTA